MQKFYARPAQADGTDRPGMEGVLTANFDDNGDAAGFIRHIVNTKGDDLLTYNVYTVSPDFVWTLVTVRRPLAEQPSDHIHHFVPVRVGTNSHHEPINILQCACKMTPSEVHA